MNPQTTFPRRIIVFDTDRQIYTGLIQDDKVFLKKPTYKSTLQVYPEVARVEAAFPAPFQSTSGMLICALNEKFASYTPLSLVDRIKKLGWLKSGWKPGTNTPA